MKSQLRKYKNTFLDILGVYDGILAYKGPRCVQIDITDECNNDCIGCWCNSPLLAGNNLPKNIQRATLKTSAVLGLIDSLKCLGTEEVYFAGGGEPFMHPDVMDILSYAKDKGFVVSVNTNFTLLDEEKIKKIVDFGVDHLIVSVWAGSAKVYSLTHPNKTKDDFKVLKNNLTFLNEYKGKAGNAPVVKVYNVMLNLNFFEMEKMIEFVRLTKSEAVEFALIDTIPGSTDKLMLSNVEANELIDLANTMKRKWGHFNSEVYLSNYESFLKKLSSYVCCEKNYDKELVHSVKCYAGWTFARVLANGDVNSCLKSHRMPIGNIQEEPFSKIWNNLKQQEFRVKTRDVTVADPYFSLIGNDPNHTNGCLRSCDNLGHSLLMAKKIDRMHFLQRWIMKSSLYVVKGMRKMGWQF